jgi:hypothetical protein
VPEGSGETALKVEVCVLHSTHKTVYFDADGNTTDKVTARGSTRAGREPEKFLLVDGQDVGEGEDYEWKCKACNAANEGILEHLKDKALVAEFTRLHQA